MVFDFFRVTPKKRTIRIRSKRGVIFSNPSSPKRLIFHLANIIFLLCIGYIVYLYYPLGYAFAVYKTSRPGSVPTTTTTTAPTGSISIRTVLSSEYIIKIPKILAEAKVTEGVSPYDPVEYLKVLEENMVAQSSTSSRPGGGQGSMTYIFAHSTEQGWSAVRKNAIFYLLGELKEGDEALINYHGNNYVYRVYKQMVVPADAVEYLRYTDPNQETLILQTCWPIGTDWKRLLVLAKRV